MGWSPNLGSGWVCVPAREFESRPGVPGGFESRPGVPGGFESRPGVPGGFKSRPGFGLVLCPST